MSTATQTAGAEAGRFDASSRTALAARLAPSGLGVLLAAAVCGPFVGGRLLLLDFVSGPHEPLVPVTAYGLGGAINGGLGSTLVFHLLDAAFGQAGSWLAAALFFPVATTAIARLVRGPLVAKLGAGLLYAVNPFVFDRLYAGQLAVLFGYAVLPFVARALLEVAKEPGSVLRASLWAGIAVALDEHVAWILVPVTIAAAATRVRPLRATAALVLAGIGAAAMSCYLLVPPLLVGTKPSAVSAQLHAFRTASDPHVGLYANVAGLYGFFRPAPEPKDLYSGWPAVLAAILVVVAVGYVAAVRARDLRRNALAVLCAGGCGYLLALGGQGPTGGIYRFLSVHLPGFVIMREPEKYVALVALAYAYGFAEGLALLADRVRTRRGYLVPGALALLLPFAYTPTLVGGLGGHVSSSHYPSSFAVAARLVGDGSVLFLPWHEYMAARYAGGRVIANPGADLFAGRVIEGEDPGRGYSFTAEDREHAVLGRSLAAPTRATALQPLLTRLGVEWVALERAAGWRSYGWLGRARGLHLAYSSRSIELYRVARSGATRAAEVRVKELSPIRYEIAPGQAGGVSLPVAYANGWRLGSQRGRELRDGEVAFQIGHAGGTATYEPSTGVLASELASAVVFAGLCATALVWRRRRRPDDREAPQS